MSQKKSDILYSLILQALAAPKNLKLLHSYKVSMLNNSSSNLQKTVYIAEAMYIFFEVRWGEMDWSFE